MIFTLKTNEDKSSEKQYRLELALYGISSSACIKLLTNMLISNKLPNKDILYFFPLFFPVFGFDD